MQWPGHDPAICHVDDRIVARSMSSACDIYYLGLHDFGAPK